MAVANRSTVVGVFESRANADRAVSELRAAGYSNDQIGIIGRDSGDGATSTEAEDRTKNSLAGAATGAAVGAGAGGLVALGILSGVIPGIGPAIAAGTLGMVLSNVGLGAARSVSRAHSQDWACPRTKPSTTKASSRRDERSSLSETQPARRGRSCVATAATTVTIRGRR